MRKKVSYNDDASELAVLRPGDAKQSLIEWIDLITDRIPVDVFAIESALPDMCECETKVGEVRGVRGAKPPHRRTAGIDALRAEGTDHLSVYVERLHEKGIVCVSEVRMSDTHHQKATLENEFCPRFCVEHPEWRIRRPDGTEEVAMDYSFPGVRSHRLAIMEELVAEYDIDGLELNFIRWGKHFHRDLGREKTPIMTGFLGDIINLLGKTAHKKGKDKLLLGVRVPSSIEECLGMGCDPETFGSCWITRRLAASFYIMDKFFHCCAGKTHLRFCCYLFSFNVFHS